MLLAIRAIDETQTRKLQTKALRENPRKTEPRNTHPPENNGKANKGPIPMHINILWNYPVADFMIYYKKREPVHKYISTDTSM